MMGFAVPAAYLAGILGVTGVAARRLPGPVLRAAARGPGHHARLLGDGLPDQPAPPAARPGPVPPDVTGPEVRKGRGSLRIPGPSCLAG